MCRKEQLEQGDERELDWVVSNLRRLSLPWGYCLHRAKATKCPYGQNVCFTKDNGPCHKLVTTPEHAPVIIATMDDLKNSRRIADLAQEIRRLREIPVPSPSDSASPTGKSEKAKDAQIARLKERVHQLERRVRDLQQENELL